MKGYYLNWGTSERSSTSDKQTIYKKLADAVKASKGIGWYGSDGSVNACEYSFSEDSKTISLTVKDLYKVHSR